MLKIRADLHIHSTYSDGKDTPSQIILAAIDKGLQAISITDHDTFMGSLKAIESMKSMEINELIIIIGAEIRTSKGDILVYCIDGPLDRIPREPLDLLDTARENNCITVPAHPFDIRRKGIGELVFEARWDAIEVYNALSDPLSNKKAREAALILGVPGIANSDAHVASAAGSAYNVIEVDEINAEGIINAIKQGRVKPISGRPAMKSLIETGLWAIRKRL